MDIHGLTLLKPEELHKLGEQQLEAYGERLELLHRQRQLIDLSEAESIALSTAQIRLVLEKRMRGQRRGGNNDA